MRTASSSRGLWIRRERGLAREDAELAGDSFSAQQADALVTVARAYLEGSHLAKNMADRTRPSHQVTVHVDRSALVDGRGRSGLPIESVRRMACDAETVMIVEDEDEQPLSVGRNTRTVPQRISLALWARDKGCTFPGCNRQRFVDAHHVKHWAQGGETSLDNLLLLCTRHHRAMHEGAFSICKDFRDQWRFFRPDGIAVPECGYVAGDKCDRTAGLSLATLVRKVGYPSARGTLAKRKTPSLLGRETARPDG